MVWRMLFSSSRVILEFRVESKRGMSGWSIIRLMFSVVDKLSLLSYFPFEFFFERLCEGISYVLWIGYVIIVSWVKKLKFCVVCYSINISNFIPYGVRRGFVCNG